MRIVEGVKIFKGISDLKVEILEHDEKSIKFSVQNTPICQFDQHSRARVGVKFSEYKVAEEPEYVLYTNLYERMENDGAMTAMFAQTALQLELSRNSAEIKDDYKTGIPFLKY